MKKNDKVKVIIVFLVALLFILIGTIIIYNDMFKNKEETKRTRDDVTELLLKDTQYDNGLLLENKRAVRICKNEENCNIKDIIFPHVSLDVEIQEIQDFLVTLNNKIDEYYSLTDKATIDNPTCQNIREKYEKSSYIPISISSYIDDNYISIAMSSQTIDLCNNTSIVNPYIIGTYDKKKNMMITEEQLALDFNITKELVYEKLKEESFDENTKTDVYLLPNISEIDYHLYINEQGKLTATCLVTDASRQQYYYEITMN